jgi:hypothetical protein
MKSKFILSLLLVLVLSCISVNENIDTVSLLSKRDCEREYQYLLSSMETNGKAIPLIKADDITAFLDEFSVVYSSFYRDYKIADWLTVLSIGDPGKLSAAEKNLDNLVAGNTNTFWKLRGNSHSRRIELWEKTFENDKTRSKGRGSADIIAEIKVVEDNILKSKNQDIQVLLSQEKQFTRLFKLRNQLAQIKGFRNHLYHVFTQDEIEKYEGINNTVLDMLPPEIGPKQNIAGLINPKPAEYFDITQRLVRGMGLSPDKTGIIYYITTDNTYNKTFMSIIEPKNECRIYMYFPKTKLYPDEYVYYLSTLMHETGHGLHFQYQDTKPLIFNFFDQTVTETIAIFFENILYSKECLEKYFPYKLTDDELRIILTNKKKSILEFFRFAVFLWNFEKSIYNNPDQDMSELYKTLAVKTHMPKTNQYRLWYDTSIFASHDLYYIHYTLAYLYAFKLRKLLEKKYGPNYYENPEVGNFLRENLFKYGNSLQPEKLFIRLFGDNILPINEYLAYLSE